jgi:hypothetical protein
VASRCTISAAGGEGGEGAVGAPITLTAGSLMSFVVRVADAMGNARSYGEDRVSVQVSDPCMRVLCVCALCIVHVH